MISLLLGLGNFGRTYAHTRHNVGFDVLDRVSDELNCRRQPPDPLYDWAIEKSGARPLILAWPTTYMNRSGLAARKIMQEHELAPSEMLAIVDDFNLPLGSLRFRRSGSDGGHNGLASMIEELGSTDFRRLRLGIGPPPEDYGISDWVLEPFTAAEMPAAEKMLALAAEAVIFALQQPFEAAMQKYNSKNDPA